MLQLLLNIYLISLIIWFGMLQILIYRKKAHSYLPSRLPKRERIAGYIILFIPVVNSLMVIIATIVFLSTIRINKPKK